MLVGKARDGVINHRSINEPDLSPQVYRSCGLQSCESDQIQRLS